MRSRVGYSNRASQSQRVWFTIAARDDIGATDTRVFVFRFRIDVDGGLEVSESPIEGILPNIASKPGICAHCHLSHGPPRCIRAYYVPMCEGDIRIVRGTGLGIHCTLIGRQTSHCLRRATTRPIPESTLESYRRPEANRAAADN